MSYYKLISRVDCRIRNSIRNSHMTFKLCSITFFGINCRSKIMNFGSVYPITLAIYDGLIFKIFPKTSNSGKVGADVEA